jgi:ABC-2 type transport system permease protein/lipopolysaccharide transport system permease protein
VVGPLELGRFVLVGGQWPGNVLFLSCGVAVLVALGGVAYFQHAARHFADVI